MYFIIVLVSISDPPPGANGTIHLISFSGFQLACSETVSSCCSASFCSVSVAGSDLQPVIATETNTKINKNIKPFFTFIPPYCF